MRQTHYTRNITTCSITSLLNSLEFCKMPNFHLCGLLTSYTLSLTLSGRISPNKAFLGIVWVATVPLLYTFQGLRRNDIFQHLLSLQFASMLLCFKITRQVIYRLFSVHPKFLGAKKHSRATWKEVLLRVNKLMMLQR